MLSCGCPSWPCGGMTVSMAASAVQLLRSYQHVQVLKSVEPAVGFSVKFPACHAGAITNCRLLTLFPFCSCHLSPMWSTVEDLRFRVKMGLRKGLARIRGMRRSLTEDQQDSVAKAIVEHLELSNWKIEQGPPLGGHGSSLIPKQE
jgi:hypothetical protein